LKVGFYYSPPDWYFDREYMNFLYGRGAKNNPWLPPLGPDLKPRTAKKSEEETKQHQAAFAAKVKGQVEELLTRYGKIDLLWFDGRPAIPNPDKCITIERIRELQPGIVINPRLHGHGDYSTYERTLPATRPDVGWAEYCNTWTNAWPHEEIPFRANGFVLGQLAQSRSWGINYLLGVGPMSNGEMSAGVYQNMAVVRDWMKLNGKSVLGTKPLPQGETASVPATAHGSVRYLFALPKFRNHGAYPEDQLPPVDEKLTLNVVQKPTMVKLLGSGKALEFSYADGVLKVNLPAALRTPLVDVAQVDLAGQ
jgi:alpha-L-fucosidase